MKVYSKIEAEKLINEIIAEKLNIGDKFGTLRGKNKAQAINQMFVALNSADAGYRSGIAQNIADFIIENAIYEDIYDDGGISEDALPVESDVPLHFEEQVQKPLPDLCSYPSLHFQSI